MKNKPLQPKTWMFLGLISLLWTACAPKPISLNQPQLPPAQFQTGISKPSVDSSASVLPWSKIAGDTFLISLIHKTLENNPGLLAEQWELREQLAQLRALRGALLPTVNLAPTAAIRRFGLYTMDGAGNASTDILPGKVVPTNLPDFLLGFQSSWEIDVRGTLRNQKKAGYERAEAARWELRLIQTELIAELVELYVDILANHETLNILNDVVNARRDAVRAADLMRASGRTNLLAVQQFQTELKEAEIMLLESQQVGLELNNALYRLCGVYADSTLLPKSKKLHVFISDSIHIGTPTELMRARPDINMRERELIAAGFDVKAAKAAFFPLLSLQSALGYQAFSGRYLLESPASLMYTLLGSMVMPLVNRNALKADYSSAQAEQQAAMYRYQNQMIEAYTGVQMAYANAEMLNRALNQGDSLATVAQAALSSAMELYTAGKATYLEVLLAQQNELEARLQQISLKAARQKAGIRLYRELGGGWK